MVRQQRRLQPTKPNPSNLQLKQEIQMRLQLIEW